MLYEHKLTTNRRDMPVTTLFERVFEMLESENYRPFVSGPGIVTTKTPISDRHIDSIYDRFVVNVRRIGLEA